MVTVTLIGMSSYYVAQVSEELGPVLANIYETTVDNINFYCPECVYLHNGVEQNGYNVLIRINAPEQVKVLEHDVVHILEKFLKDACINMQVVFYYYCKENYHEIINDDYPRFLTQSNTVTMGDDEYTEDYEDDCNCHDCDEEKEEPYLGNIFKDFNVK